MCHDTGTVETEKNLCRDERPSAGVYGEDLENLYTGWLPQLLDSKGPPSKKARSAGTHRYILRRLVPLCVNFCAKGNLTAQSKVSFLFQKTLSLGSV